MSNYCGNTETCECCSYWSGSDNFLRRLIEEAGYEVAYRGEQAYVPKNWYLKKV